MSCAGWLTLWLRLRLRNCRAVKIMRVLNFGCSPQSECLPPPLVAGSLSSPGVSLRDHHALRSLDLRVLILSSVSPFHQVPTLSPKPI